MLDQWPYLGVFLVLIAASLGLPMPEDVWLLTGGYFCHQGMAKVPIMIAVGMFGVLGGDVMLFMIGRQLGHRVVHHRFLRRLVNPSRLLAAERLFAKHGVKIVFFGRFLPGLRPMIFMAAGVLKVRPVVFVGVNGIAACISVPTLVILGNVFGDSLDQIKHDVRIVGHTIAVVAIILGLVGGGIWLHLRQKRLMSAEPMTRMRREDLADLPPVVTDCGGSQASPGDEAHRRERADKEN